MAAAAEAGGDERRVPAGDGPDGELAAAGALLPEGGCHLHAGDGPGKIGDIVHIVLGEGELPLHGLGDRHDGELSVTEELHMLHDPALDPEAAQGIGLEELLVQLIDPGAGGGALGGGGEGVVGGIGEAEAAGVRGGAHIDGLGQGRVHPGAHGFHNVPNKLRAGSAVRVHQLQVGEGGGGAVMVDPQSDMAQVLLKSLGQHLGGGHVGGHEDRALLGLLHGQPLMEPLEPGGDLAVGQDEAGLAQAPEPQAQGRGGADGIAVGAAVGQQAEVIPLQEPPGGIIPRQRHRG